MTSVSSINKFKLDGTINMKSGVYQILHRPSGNSYVGSSKNIRSRWNEHKSLLRRNIHPSPRFQNTWNKYGENEFEFIVLQECDPVKEVLITIEQHYIDLLHPVYNVNPIASSRLGSKNMPESNLKKKGYVNAIKDGQNIRVTKEEYRNQKLTCNNTGKTPVVDENGNRFLADKNHPNIKTGLWQHVAKHSVSVRNTLTGETKTVSKEEFESDPCLVGIRKGMNDGANNPNSKRIAIYDSEHNLIAECHGNFESYCINNNLPFTSLRDSMYKGGAPIITTNRQESYAKRRGYFQYKGWSAKLLG